MKKPRAKDLIAPLGHFYDFFKEVESLRMIASQGITMVSRSEKLTQVLCDLDVNDKKISLQEADRKIEYSAKTAKEAQIQMDNNFRVLVNHSLVSIWGALESSIKQFVATLIYCQPNILQNESFNKIKIFLCDYECLTKKEKAEYVAECILRQSNIPLKPGVDRFEKLLEYVAMSGPVDNDIKRTCYEVSQVRNLIVHSSSIVDSQFKKNCPWLKVKKGVRYELNMKVYKKYIKALMQYATVVIERIVEKYPNSESKEKLKK